MKILRFFLLAVLTLSVTACGDDDSPTVELTTSNLVGTYDIIFLESNSVETDNGSGVVVERTQSVGDTFTNAMLVLNQNATYTVSGSYRVTETITTTGESPTTETEIENLDDSGSFSVNTTSRTITFDGEVNDVTLFDGANLYLTNSDSEVIDGNTTVFNTEIRLVKQN